MDEKVAILNKIQEIVCKMGRHIDLESRYLINNGRGEVHIAISSQQRMGRIHRNVRAYIRTRAAKTRLKHFDIYLYLNPIHPGSACMVWVMKRGTGTWKKETVNRLPSLELVA